MAAAKRAVAATPRATKKTGTLTFVRSTKTYHVYEDKTRVLCTGTIYLSKEQVGETAPDTVSFTVTF